MSRNDARRSSWSLSYYCIGRGSATADTLTSKLHRSTWRPCTTKLVTSNLNVPSSGSFNFWRCRILGVGRGEDAQIYGVFNLILTVHAALLQFRSGHFHPRRSCCVVVWRHGNPDALRLPIHRGDMVHTEISLCNRHYHVEYTAGHIPGLAPMPSFC